MPGGSLSLSSEGAWVQVERSVSHFQALRDRDRGRLALVGRGAGAGLGDRLRQDIGTGVKLRCV